jgi:hypothetical protein
MAEYQPGKMNIRDQEKTFAGFVKFATWGFVAILVFLVFLALAGA